MSEELNSYMLKTAKGDKESFRFIANTLGYKMHATAIKILALGNPGPDVVTFKFGPLSATRSASTRIRLRKTQDVLAIAKLEDGSFIQDIQKVKVTIGGCGG